MSHTCRPLPSSARASPCLTGPPSNRAPHSTPATPPPEALSAPQAGSGCPCSPSLTRLTLSHHPGPQVQQGWGRHRRQNHFTDGETEAQTDQRPAWGHREGGPSGERRTHPSPEPTWQSAELALSCRGCGVCTTPHGPHGPGPSSLGCPRLPWPPPPGQ